MELLDPAVRCKRCFSYLEHDHATEGCEHCSQLPWPLLKLGAVFPYRGAPAILLKRFKYGKRTDLSQTLGAYLVVQWSRLEWPLPDYIVPMPISKVRLWTRGYNQSQLLAEVLADYLNVPICQAIERKSGDWSQAGLSTSQRQELSNSSFFLTQEAEKIRGKTVLLLDDVFTTGKTLEQCAAVLLEGAPRTILGLTLCRAN